MLPPTIEKPDPEKSGGTGHEISIFKRVKGTVLLANRGKQGDVHFVSCFGGGDDVRNIFDYLEWRGDLSFARDGFNEVDNLVMSMLAYLKFDGVVPPDPGAGPVTLSMAAKQPTCRPSTPENSTFSKKVTELFMKAAQSVRYRDIGLSGYVDQVDHERSKQFSATVFSINRKQHFIAFRGTDDTLAGWKEDFRMSFMDQVQAQQDAAAYLEKNISNYKGDLYLGGHSKGGNLAVYAAAHAAAGMQNRIIGIYNNDGPGFHAKVIQSKGYQSILNRINTFVPGFSVVGLLLEHGTEYTVVSSDGTGIMQHDAFSWQVSGTRFVYEQGLKKSSSNFNKTLRSWLDGLALDQRAQFVDGLFDIIEANGALTVSELSGKWLTEANNMIKAFKNMDPLTKSFLKKTVQLFFKEYQKVLKTSIKEDIGSFFSKKLP